LNESMRRIELAFQALTFVFVTLAALALLWRPAAPSAEIPPDELSAHAKPETPLAAVDPTDGQTIVASNIFSASRTAPRERYRPYGMDAASAPSPAPGYPAETASTSADGEAVPHLYGTIVGPQGTAALLRLDPAVQGAQLYRVGDTGGKYRVTEIAERSVVLTGPRGRIVLRLDRAGG
jgi:hypothetical protein